MPKALPRLTLGRAWIATVVLYSIVRAIPVAFAFGPYGVNAWVFLAIDVLTAFPYAYGQVVIVRQLKSRHHNPQQILLWSAVVALSFVAPYAYLGLYGQAMPPGAIALLVGFIVIGLGLSGWSFWRKLHSRKLPSNL